MKTMCLPYWLSPQWLCSNSCTWAHDLHKIMCPSCLCVYYVHLAYVRFEHSVCHGSDIYIYIYIYIYIIKTMDTPTNCHYIGVVTTHPLGHMM